MSKSAKVVLVARLTPPSHRFAVLSDVVCGVLLSVPICVKFYFAAFVLVIDVPILMQRRIAQSYTAFWAMVAGGIVQTAIFFLTYFGDLHEILLRYNSYYTTIGMHYSLVFAYLVHRPVVYITLAAFALVLFVNLRTGRSIIYAAACGGTAIVCLVLFVMQGFPRPYNLIPLYLAGLACPLYAAFSMSLTRGESDPWKIVSGRRVFFSGIAAVVAVAILVGDSGFMRALYMRYVQERPDTAQVGPVPRDQYMQWVEKHVTPNEEIYVIALQYGLTSAFDPVLSTIRLGRRVDSASPIFELPLREALVTGDRERIDAAWDTLIKEIATSRPAWVVIRRTTPAPMAPDFFKIIEAEPRFYTWLIAHYSRYDTFGPYVAYRRLQ